MALITTEEAAKRLARVILSDIELYSRERPQAGENLAAQIEEGRRLFRSRVAPAVVPLFDVVLADRRVASEKTPVARVTATPAPEPGGGIASTPMPAPAVASTPAPMPVATATLAATAAAVASTRTPAPTLVATPAPVAVAALASAAAVASTPAPVVATLAAAVAVKPAPSGLAEPDADRPTPGLLLPHDLEQPAAHNDSPGPEALAAASALAGPGFVPAADSQAAEDITATDPPLLEAAEQSSVPEAAPPPRPVALVAAAAPDASEETPPAPREPHPARMPASTISPGRPRNTGRGRLAPETGLPVPALARAPSPPPASAPLGPAVEAPVPMLTSRLSLPRVLALVVVAASAVAVVLRLLS